MSLRRNVGVGFGFMIASMGPFCSTPTCTLYTQIIYVIFISVLYASSNTVNPNVVIIFSQNVLDFESAGTSGPVARGTTRAGGARPDTQLPSSIFTTVGNENELQA